MLIIGLQFSILAGIGLFIGGFLLPDLVLNVSNQSDNNSMLLDIKAVFDVLRIQSKAGVFMSDILSDCYLVVANKRLKDAFLKLSSDIMANSDLSTSIETMNGMFQNEYISTLSVIINQSLATGSVIELLDDIKKQLEDIDIMLMEQEKARIRRKIVITQAMIYLGIVAASIFLAASQLGGNGVL